MMQSYYSKSECKNHGHYDREDIETTVMSRWIEPYEENSRERKSCQVASKQLTQQAEQHTYNIPHKAKPTIN